MQDNTESRSNPKDRNFDQDDVGGKSKSTTGKKQKEEEAQDDYNAQDRDFDQGQVSDQPAMPNARKPDEEKDEDHPAPNRNIDPSVRQGTQEGPHT